MRIEDHGLIGDTQTAGLVSRDGSIDWLCLPRFDSGACFASLLGDPHHGRWRIGPAGAATTRRRYRPDTLVLETDHQTPDGTVRVVDFMPIRDETPNVVRVVVGQTGPVLMEMDLEVRFEYGSLIPWVKQIDGRQLFVAGPDALELRTPIETRGEGLSTVAEFEVDAGDVVPFVLTWYRSHDPAPRPIEPASTLDKTTSWWQQWTRQCDVSGPLRDEIARSLITLKALTHAPTGGVVAAATTSLPEAIGGERNWDYRYCWLRDATFSLYAFLLAGFDQEAAAWRDWLVRAVAGSPEQLQSMYGPAGERRLTELELPWLPGYENSAPVRIGNAAAKQFQLDIYGEAMDSLHLAREAGIEPDEHAWSVQQALMDFLEGSWSEPDAGIWEVRGPPRHFTHSKVMAWVAADRAVKAVERFDLSGLLIDGVTCERRSAAMSAIAATTPTGTRSRSPTVGRSSMRAC